MGYVRIASGFEKKEKRGHNKEGGKKRKIALRERQFVATRHLRRFGRTRDLVTLRCAVGSAEIEKKKGKKRTRNKAERRSLGPERCFFTWRFFLFSVETKKFGGIRGGSRPKPPCSAASPLYAVW